LDGGKYHASKIEYFRAVIGTWLDAVSLPGLQHGLRPVFSAIWAPHKESTESEQELHTYFGSTS